MADRYSLGSTARIYLDIVSSGAGVISQTPSAYIQRASDSRWLGLDGEWYASPVEHPMTQLQATFQPGRYYVDFDQSQDASSGAAPRYIVKLENTGTPPALEYKDLVFGKEPMAKALELCSVQGTIASAQGEAVHNALIRATVQPIYRDALGRTVQVDEVVKAYSDTNGDFDIPLVRGTTVKLEIDAVGYDRKFLVPDQATAIFTEL